MALQTWGIFLYTLDFAHNLVKRGLIHIAPRLRPGPKDRYHLMPARRIKPASGMFCPLNRSNSASPAPVQASRRAVRTDPLWSGTGRMYWSRAETRQQQYWSCGGLAAQHRGNDRDVFHGDRIAVQRITVQHAEIRVLAALDRPDLVIHLEHVGRTHSDGVQRL